MAKGGTVEIGNKMKDATKKIGEHLRLPKGKDSRHPPIKKYNLNIICNYNAILAKDFTPRLRETLPHYFNWTLQYFAIFSSSLMIASSRLAFFFSSSSENWCFKHNSDTIPFMSMF